MIARLLAAALLSGIAAGVLISVVQEFTTTPIVLLAESHEPASGDRGHAQGGTPDHDHGHDHGHDAQAWMPRDGLERSLWTAVTNVLAGVAYAALLIVAFHLRGDAVDGRKGLVWGIAGFAVFAAAPALGLAPTVPGIATADVVARQAWWAFAALSTAAGLWLVFLSRPAIFVVVGLVLLVLPHAVGAPGPDMTGSAVPAELAGRFVAASLVTSLVFWALLGWMCGLAHARLVPRHGRSGHASISPA